MHVRFQAQLRLCSGGGKWKFMNRNICLSKNVPPLLLLSTSSCSGTENFSVFYWTRILVRTSMLQNLLNPLLSAWEMKFSCNHGHENSLKNLVINLFDLIHVFFFHQAPKEKHRKNPWPSCYTMHLTLFPSFRKCTRAVVTSNNRLIELKRIK